MLEPGIHMRTTELFIYFPDCFAPLLQYIYGTGFYSHHNQWSRAGVDALHNFYDFSIKRTNRPPLRALHIQGLN